MKAVAAAFLMAFVLSAPTQDASQRDGDPVRPAPGVFLVAKPSIEGGPFFHGVVLLVSHGEVGSLGLIVNRVTELPFSEALPELSGESEEPHPLFFGGPVALNGLLFLFRTEDAPPKAAHVMEDVYFASDAEMLKGLLKEGLEPVRRLRLYLGHAGWAPGQLDMEILRGDWTVLRADAFTVFQKDPDRMWSELADGARVVAGLEVSTSIAPATAASDTTEPSR